MTEIEEKVISKIRERRDVGREKYNTSMERIDLSRLQWLIHAQEEMLDAAIYLEKLISFEESKPMDYEQVMRKITNARR